MFVIAGCAGGLYDSIVEAASILKGRTGGCGEYALSVYPASQPVMMALADAESDAHALQEQFGDEWMMLVDERLKNIKTNVRHGTTEK